MLVALAAFFAANVSSEPQAPAKQRATAASQDRANSSAADKSSQSAASAGKREIPCKTPENASLCYWTHGRLAFYPVDPPLRIWKIGTDRLLGVFSGPSGFPPRDNHLLSLPELPENLDRVYRNPSNWEPPFMDDLAHDHIYYSDDVFADFEVCPLVPKKKGKMQAVCIESAKNILVQK
jgi:hypothetical protein